MSLKKIISLSLGLVILASVAVLIPSSTVGAQSPRLNPLLAATLPPSVPVSVVNTPLPVSGNVGVSSLPPLNATVTGNVGVTSLPPVTGTVNANVTGSVAVTNSPTVSFSNTAAAPLYVDTDRAARNSFMAACSTTYDPNIGQASCTIFGPIQSNGPIVIETVACTAEVPSGQGVAQADLVIPNGGSNFTIPLAMTLQSPGNPVDIWAITSQIHVFAQGSGSSLGVFYRGAPNLPPQGMNCVISGYTVQP